MRCKFATQEQNRLTSKSEGKISFAKHPTDDEAGFLWRMYKFIHNLIYIVDTNSHSYSSVSLLTFKVMDGNGCCGRR